jgi:hypothetical protein
VLGEDQLSVDEDVELAWSTDLERGVERGFFLDRGRETRGAGFVVSDEAVLDDDALVHDPIMANQGARRKALAGEPWAWWHAHSGSRALRAALVRVASQHTTGRCTRSPPAPSCLARAELVLAKPKRRIVRWESKPVELSQGRAQLEVYTEIPERAETATPRSRRWSLD